MKVMKWINMKGTPFASVGEIRLIAMLEGSGDLTTGRQGGANGLELDELVDTVG